MDTKRLAKFLIITFVITGIAWSGLAVLTSLNIIPFSHPLGTILHIIGGFGPTIATFFVLEEKNTVKSILDFIFGYRKKSLIFLFLFSIFEILTIGLSSMELNSALPWYLMPLIFLQATFIYGGEEELGWRGVMQPLLEEKLNFPIATIITGVVWGIWHIPPLVCKWLIATKYAISLFLSVSCYTELLAGDNLQKNEMCFCL